jgi:hypothetical protein
VLTVRNVADDNVQECSAQQTTPKRRRVIDSDDEDIDVRPQQRKQEVTHEVPVRSSVSVGRNNPMAASVDALANIAECAYSEVCVRVRCTVQQNF